jgi:hypothetical protein
MADAYRQGYSMAEVALPWLRCSTVSKAVSGLRP